MKRRYPIIAILITLLLACFSFYQNNKQVPQKRTTILFYHEMNGPAAASLNGLVKEYNRSQNKYKVVAEYQGSYNEAVEKFINTHNTKVSPAVFQSMDISTAQLAQSRYTIPIQRFINRSHYDQSQISQAARSYYSYRGKLMAMPFNVSQPVLFYNKTLFKKYHVANLPLKPSYADVERAARQLYTNSQHKVKGISVEPYSWLFEEFLANDNAPLASGKNGHEAAANKFTFNHEAAAGAMSWLQRLNQSGIMVNYGYSSNSDTNEIGGFLARKIGMFMQTSSQLVQLQSGGHDQVGVCYYPHQTGKPANGVSIGGAALWISSDHSQKVQHGVWDFIRFLLSPKIQAQWAVETGYIAANNRSANSRYLREYFKRDPQAKVATEQLRATRPDAYNSGSFITGLPQDRIQIQNMMDRIYDGGSVHRNLQQTNNELTKQLQQVNLADR